MEKFFYACFFRMDWKLVDSVEGLISTYVSGIVYVCGVYVCGVYVCVVCMCVACMCVMCMCVVCVFLPPLSSRSFPCTMLHLPIHSHVLHT